MSAPVGRLAPSPTGRLHLGHARSFLLAWWSARSRGGRVLLRIEDLDATRVRPGSADAILADLEWLGLDWDGPPLLQSADTSAMEGACRRLAELGRAYACVCTRGEIAALSAPQEGDEEQRYSGTCRGRYAGPDEARRASGREPALRFAVPPGPVAIEDGLQGRASFDVAAEVGDFLVRRRDGSFAYQLAVVVDDARTGVDEVLRGLDLLPSAARQAALQDCLGLPRPRWIHVPLVVDEHGRRLAKRDSDLSLTALRERGVDPRAVASWAAAASGIACSERESAAALAPRFELARVPREAVVLGAEAREQLLGAR